MYCGVPESESDVQPIAVAGTVVECVQSFVYLGCMITPDARVGSEVDRRIAKASSAFGALRCIFDDRQLSIKTKRLLYSACVVTVLLYGSECWPILRRDEDRIDVFHHQCIRTVLGVSRWDQQLLHMHNSDLRQMWGDTRLMSDILRQRRLQWLGHVSRMPEDRVQKQVLFGWLAEPRPAHGVRLRWRDRVAADLRLLHIPAHEWFEVAQERPDWRNLYQMAPDHAPSHPPVVCGICQRSFKSRGGMTRHKCTVTRNQPKHLQPGARQCPTCERWFVSAGGFTVHRCGREPTSVLSPEAPATRVALTTLACCSNHCQDCNRCFKSLSGFGRHNFQRGARITDRSTLPIACTDCSRRFRFERDLKRHKCGSRR